MTPPAPSRETPAGRAYNDLRNLARRDGRDTVEYLTLYASYKHEDYYRHVFATKAELVAGVDDWMSYYNHERRHSAIEMRSPINYEYMLKATQQTN